MDNSKLIEYAKQLRSEGKSESEIAEAVGLALDKAAESAIPAVEAPVLTTEAEVDDAPVSMQSLLEESTNERKLKLDARRGNQNTDEWRMPEILDSWKSGTIDREVNNDINSVLQFGQKEAGKDISFNTYGKGGTNTFNLSTKTPEKAYENIKALHKERAAIPKDAVQQAWENIQADESLSEWEKTKRLVSFGVTHPSILTELSVTSMASAPEAILLSTLGGIAGLPGMLIGGALGSYGAERANAVANLLTREGIDISKKEDLIALSKDTKKQDEIISSAEARGAAVAGTEGLFSVMTLGFNKLAPKSLGTKLLKRGAQFLTEVFGEGAGEAAGQVAEGSELSPSEIATEMLASGGQSSATTAVAAANDTKKAITGEVENAVSPTSIQGMMDSAVAQSTEEETTASVGGLLQTSLEEVKSKNKDNATSTVIASETVDAVTSDTPDLVDVEEGTVNQNKLDEQVDSLFEGNSEEATTPETTIEATPEVATEETKAETKETKKKPKKDTKEDTKKEPKKEGMAVYAAGRAVEEGLEFSSDSNSKVSRDLDKARKTGNKEAIAGLEAWQTEYKAEQEVKKAAKDKKVAKEQEVAKAAREVEVAKKKKETAKKKTQKEALKAKEKARKKAEPKPKEKAKPVEKVKPTPEVEVTPVPKETGDNTSEFNKKQIAYREEKKAKLDAKKEEDSAVVDQELTDEQKDAKAKIAADKVRNKKRTGQTPKTPKEEAKRKREPLEKRYKEAYKKVKALEEAVRNASHPDNKEKRSQTLALAQQKLAEADDNLRDLRNKQNSEGTITTSKNHPNFDSQTTAQIEKLGRVATNEAAVAKQKELDTSFSNGGAVDFENDMRASRSEDQSKARGKKHIQGDSKQVTLAGKDGEVHTTLDGNVKVVPSIQDYFKTRLDEIITALDSPKLSKTQKVFFTATLSFLRNFINSDFLTTITELQKKQGNLTMRVVEADKITSKNDKGLFVEAAGLFSPANNLLFVSRATSDKGALSSIETTIHELMHAIQMIVKDAINNSDIKLEATESFFNYTRAVNGEYRHKDFRNTAKILDIMDQIVKTGKVGKDAAKQLKDLGASDALISLIVDNNDTDLFGGVYNKLAYALSDVDGGEVLSHIADPYFQFALSNISSTAPTTAKPQSIFSKLINQFVDIYQKVMPMFLKTEKAVLESSIYNALQSKLDSFINEIKVAEITEGNEHLDKQAASTMLKIGDTKLKTISLKMEAMKLKDEAEANGIIDAYNKRAGKGKGITKPERAKLINFLDFGGTQELKNLAKLNKLLSVKLTRSKRKKKVSTGKAEAEYIAFIEFINYLRDPKNGFTIEEIISAQNKVIEELELNAAEKKTKLFSIFSKLSNKFSDINSDMDWKIAAFEIAKFERLAISEQITVLAALELTSKDQKIQLKAETLAKKKQIQDNIDLALGELVAPKDKKEHTVYRTKMEVKKGQRIKAHLTYYIMKADAILPNRKALIDNASSTEPVISAGLALKRENSKKGVLNFFRNLNLYGSGVDTVIETLTQRFGQHKKAYQSKLAFLGDAIRTGHWRGFIGTQKKLATTITEKQVELFGGKVSTREKQMTENRKYRDFTFNGTTTEMTYNEAYKKWMEFQNPEARKRFEKHNHGVEYESALESFLPSQVLEYAAWQINDFYPALYEEINAVYKRVYGVNLVKRDFYSPIYTQTQANALDTNANVLEFQGNLDEISNSGLLELTTTDEMPAVVDGDQSLMTHVQRMSYFIGMAEPVASFRAVFKNTEVRAAIETYHNPEILKTLDYMMDLQNKGGYMHSNGTTPKNIDTLRKLSTVGTLANNLTLLPKQMMSFASYTSEMPVGSFAVSSAATLAKLTTGNKELVNWIKNNDYIKHRWSGNIERDLADVMHTLNDKKMLGKASYWNTIQAASMFPTRLGDIGAVILGGYGYYQQEYKSLIKEGKTPEQAEYEATNRFAKVTDMSQQSSNINDMSQMQTESAWTRLFTMYLTTPFLYWRMAHTAGSDLALAVQKGNKVPKERVQDSLKRVQIFYFILPALFTFAAQGFMLDKDEDDEDKYSAANIATTAFTGSVQGIPVMGSIIGWLVNKVMLGKNYQFSGSPIFSGVVKVGGFAPGFIEKLSEVISEDGRSFEQMMNELTTEEIFEALEAASVLLAAAGWGVGAPLRTIKGHVMADEWERAGYDTESFAFKTHRAFGYNVEQLHKPVGGGGGGTYKRGSNRGKPRRQIR